MNPQVLNFLAALNTLREMRAACARQNLPPALDDFFEDAEGMLDDFSGDFERACLNTRTTSPSEAQMQRNDERRKVA